MASILGLGTALPNYCHSQESIARQLAEKLDFPPEKWEKLVRIFGQSKIEQRYSVIPEFLTGSIYGGDRRPSTFERNEVYRQEAPELAAKAAAAALESWGGDPGAITHVIAVSCTGIMAPGIEFLLIDRLGLSRKVDRIGLNFMGCFGAFRALSVAKALAMQDPSHRVLLVCVELCTLHCQFDMLPDTFVANALFADGSGAAVVGVEEAEKALWKLAGQAQLAIEESLDDMTWTAGDTGFLMRLSAQVPAKIASRIASYCSELIGGRAPLAECDWAVHPGGKRVLEKVGEACGLLGNQLDASWEILAKCGNISSATLLFILEQLQKQKASKEWTIGLGFGPGLSIEGLLLQRGGRV